MAYIFDFIVNLVLFGGYLKLLQNEIRLTPTIVQAGKFKRAHYFQKKFHLAQVFEVAVAQYFLIDP
jgi:hypothetical protein